MRTTEDDDNRVADALARLRGTVDVPPFDPARERALLAAFDVHQAGLKRQTARWTWAAAAALVVITVGLNWLVVSNGPRVAAPGAPGGSDVIDLADFAPWPGADAFPPFESGSLVRVDLPVSALARLGLSAPLSAAGVVQADIVIGQDGLARAVRFVQ